MADEEQFVAPEVEIPVRKIDLDDAEYAAPAITGPLDEPPKRRRGRPKGSKNRPKGDVYTGKIGGVVTAATKREDLDKVESKVADRAKAILMSATGVIAVWRPHWQMTEQEADNIVQPGASWVRAKSGDNIETVEKWLDDFDLIAVGLAVMAYMIRVLMEERALNAAERAKRIPDTTQPRADRGRFARHAPTSNGTANGSTETTQEAEQESGSSFEPDPSYTGGLRYSAPPAPGN